MTDLGHKILDRIRKEGRMTFDIFMEMALYDPEFGYYTSGPRAIGREGDFYTSAHLHPVFGAMIGKQIAGMWEFMGRPDDFMIIEMGAGEGYLCRDMLDSFRNSDDPGLRAFLDRSTYTIVEMSPVYMKKQQALLSGYDGKVSWRGRIDELSPFIGCLVSNELLDAFPVHLVQMEEILKEVYVAGDEEGFREILGGVSREDILTYFTDQGISIGKGFRTEVNLRMKEWISDISRVMKEGFIFTVDYGYPADEYYSDDRDRGTLLCYYRHQVGENPYVNIGEQDMTAHINFSALKRWGEASGFKTSGYCRQGVFLVSMGIDEEIRRLAHTSKDYLFELARIKKLILPGTLGDTHKVMIQYKGEGEPVLRGFTMKNQVKNL